MPWYIMLTMIQVALIEDNREDRERFEMIFNDYQTKVESKFSLTVFENGSDFRCSFQGQFDVLFMDIELPDANGIDLCRQVRQSDEHVVIVFLTNMAQFAIHGYEVNAIDFMLKPLVPNIFPLKMQKILAAVHAKQKLDINLTFNGGRRVLRSGDIVYAEVVKHDMIFHTVNGTVVERYTMKELEKELSKSHFSRPNYCYLVNLDYVQAIDKFDLSLKTGDVLQISRNRRKEFMDDFARYIGGSL